MSINNTSVSPSDASREVPIEVKISLTGGADFWRTHAVPEIGLPSVLLSDGPHGIRTQPVGGDHLGRVDAIPSTCFPPAVGLASTWDPDLVRQVGAALGREAKSLGVGILLGPGANLKRSPLCGRNFEYFSEDPLLTAALASAYVQGVQGEGVGTSLKHFAANNQETDRMRRDAQVDERTLRELYLRAFGKVVRDAAPWTVMCSYNSVNGALAAQNRFLLTDVLRDEWAFDGIVVSDWGAVRDPAASIDAGLDLEMPGSVDHDARIREGLRAGTITEETVERAYRRIVEVLRRAHTGAIPERPDLDAHHELARAAAERSIVLLENDGMLPLSPTDQVAVIGEFARTPRYQGAGSSRVNPTRVEDALGAIERLLGRVVPFAPGFATDPAVPVPASAHAEAVALAAGSESVLLFLGLGEAHESEGYDRTTLDLPAEQLALLDDILQVNRNVVVVLSNGSSVLVEPFAQRVRAIVEGWLLGQAGGLAIADALFGVVNPSGKTAETIPRRLEDVPSFAHFPGDRSGVRYGEGLFVGYRGYDRTRTPVAYPFGHGLSYTTFAYSDLRVGRTSSGLRVQATITNTGDRMGREVVQVYTGLPDSEVTRAERELGGFADIHLAPQESGEVVIEITDDDLRYWDATEGIWRLENGDYAVWLGASSRDLRLHGTVLLDDGVRDDALDLDSTFDEAMRHPGWMDAFRRASPEIADAVDAQPRMLGEIPLRAIARFAGLPESRMIELIDEVAPRG